MAVVAVKIQLAGYCCFGPLAAAAADVVLLPCSSPAVLHGMLLRQPAQRMTKQLDVSAEKQQAVVVDHSLQKRHAIAIDGLHS